MAILERKSRPDAQRLDGAGRVNRMYAPVFQRRGNGPGGLREKSTGLLRVSTDRPLGGSPPRGPIPRRGRPSTGTSRHHNSPPSLRLARPTWRSRPWLVIAGVTFRLPTKPASSSRSSTFTAIGAKKAQEICDKDLDHRRSGAVWNELDPIFSEDSSRCVRASIPRLRGRGATCAARVSMNIKRLMDLGVYRGPASPPQPAGPRPAHAHERPLPASGKSKPIAARKK